MIINHPILNAFHIALDDNIEDWDTRLVMADWYDEQGDEVTAAAIRWQVENKKMPRRIYGAFGWYDVVAVTEVRGQYMHPPSDLPQRLWECLSEKVISTTSKKWRTRRLAEEALWQAHPTWVANYLAEVFA